MPDHDRQLHLGCGPCRKALSISYHKDHPPKAAEQFCTNCDEPLEEIEHHQVTGLLTHPAWEEDQ